jgi:hypothetical protein
MDTANITRNRNTRTRNANRATATSYILVSNTSENDFTSEVTDKIRQGYIPQGGVSVVFIETTLYTQAMVKY